MDWTISKDRIIWLDIAKGIAIILMVIGHSSIPQSLSNFIWSFHMPLFFIASGWCTNWDNDGFGVFTLRKTKLLLIPFVIYSCIVLITKQLMGGGNIPDVLINGWQGTPLWFIPVLFMALVLSKTITSVNNKNIQSLLWVACAVFGTVLSYEKVRLPWTLCSVPYACFLIILGSHIRKYQEYINIPRWWLLVSGFMIATVVSHFYRLDMAWNNITPVTILTLGACAGTSMIFTLSSYIGKYTKWASRILQSVGKETYIILAFSELPIMICNQYFTTNIIVKYLILVVVLIALIYIKDGVNKLANTKIL